MDPWLPNSTDKLFGNLTIHFQVLIQNVQFTHGLKQVMDPGWIYDMSDLRFLQQLWCATQLYCAGEGRENRNMISARLCSLSPRSRAAVPSSAV